jgi:hypothetical protein
MRSLACTLLLASLGAWQSALLAASDAGARGYFRYDQLKLELRHGYAFRVEKNDTPGEFETFLYLTSAPIDAEAAATAFDLDDGVDSQMPSGDEPGGFVRICINSDGSECGLWFLHDNPLESFNTSGFGKFQLDDNGPERFKGSWVVAEPEDFFDKTYQFEMYFDAALAEPASGEDLGAGGGAPGKAYSDYIAALAAGDFVRLRELHGEEGRWMFPEDDPDAARETLKWRRDGVPVKAAILAGVRRGDEAVLMVEGVDRDEIKRRGRVLMARDGGTWRYKSADLDSVD